MKKIKMTLAIAIVMLAIGACDRQKEESTPTKIGYGTATFNCTAQNSADEMTRSESGRFIIPDNLIPDSNDIVLKLSGSYKDSKDQIQEFSYGPLTLGEYNQAPPVMIEGDDYSAYFEIGEPNTEGEEAVYFSTSIDFKVAARANRTIEVNVPLQKAIISLSVDEMFSLYYHDASFRVTTSAGNSFDFVVPTDKIVFVEAGSTLSLSGTAYKINGDMVTFNENVIGTTKAKTMSRINITSGGVGGNNVNIVVDETITDIEGTTIELNK